MKDLWDSLVRTFCPLIVGTVVGWFVAAGIELDPATEGALTVVLTGVFTAVYYIVARLLEVYVSPRFGWLLGLARQPEYAKRGRYAAE